MVTKADIELYFNGTVTLDEDFANNTINQNTAYVSQIIGKPLGSNNVVEEVNVYENTNRIQLIHVPIISVNSVYVNKKDEFTPSWEEVTDYFIEDKDLGIIKLKEVITAGLRKLKVDYNYGIYPVPEEVNKLILDLCVMDVLKMIANSKIGNSDADTIDLGAIRLQGNYTGIFNNLAQLRAEINELIERLYKNKSGFRL